MKTIIRLLSAILITMTLFTMFAPSVSAQISITELEKAINKANEPTYTREYSFNSEEKKAENDRILTEPGAWHWLESVTTRFVDLNDKSNSGYHSLQSQLSSKDKFKGFTSLGTAHSSWTIVDPSSDSNYVSIPSINQSHPRLLVTEDTIPTIRKALEEHTATNDRFFDLLDTSMEEVNSFKLDSVATLKANGEFGDDPDNPTYEGRAGLHNYRKDLLEIIQIKALGYLVDGHELYGYQAIHGLRNYLNTLDIQYIKTNMERENGNVAFTVALVFDWCYDLLDATDKTQLMSAVQNITFKGTMTNGEKKMHCGYPPFSNGSVGAVAGHGSEREILRDYLSVAVAFYGEGTAANNWWTYISQLVYSQYVPVRNYYFNSGLTQQGIGVYVSGRHISDMYSAWILKTATGEQPYAKINTTVRSFLGWETQPNYIYSDGDGGYVAKSGVKLIAQQNTYELRSLAYMTAYIFNDAEMLTYARQMPNTSSSKDPYYGGYYGADTIELTSAMYVALTGMSDMTYDSTLDKYKGMPLIQYNGSPMGQYVTHEAYGVEDSASAYMRIKERYTANHEHLDAGTFMIYYKGMLTSDGGVYDSYGSNQQRYYHTGTVSHNGLLIYNPDKPGTTAYKSDGSVDTTKTEKNKEWYSGGQDFKDSPASYAELKSTTNKAGNVVGHRHAYTDSTKTSPLYAYIAGDITASYHADTVDHVGRRMLTVYTGDEKVPMLFFTYDTITADSSNYTQKYLLQIPSSQSPTVKDITTSGGSTYKTIKTENGEGQLVLTCISGVDSHTGVKGYTINGTEVASNSTGVYGRVELILPTAKSNKLLNAMYVTDAGTTEYYEFEGITNVSTGGFTTSGAIDLEGCVFNNSIAAVFTKKNLSSSSSFVNCTMSFTAPGTAESMSYYVDGLEGGNWIVTVGGETVGIYKASNGLLTFEAPAGAVTLTKESGDVANKRSELQTALGTKISNDDGTYTAESYAAYSAAYDEIDAQIMAATTLDQLNAINVTSLKAAAEAKLVSAIEVKKAEMLTALGDKISNGGNIYTALSYQAYESAYDDLVSRINSATDIATLNAMNIDTLKAEMEAKLALAVVEDVISVDVMWTDIEFSYNSEEKQWDPDSHTYDSENGETGWEDSTGEIIVVNRSNVAIDVTVTYSPPNTQNGTVALTVNNGQFTLNAMADGGQAASHTVTVLASGDPEDDSGIGSLKVQIKKKS